MAKSIIGMNGSIGAGSTPMMSLRPAPLEDRDDHAVGGADRQQVHDHGLERHEQRAEHRHQQQERQRQHGPEEVGEPAGEVVGEVDHRGHEAGDQDVEPGAGGRLGQHVLRGRLDQLVGGLVLGGRGGHRPARAPPRTPRGSPGSGERRARPIDTGGGGDGRGDRRGTVGGRGVEPVGHLGDQQETAVEAGAEAVGRAGRRPGGWCCPRAGCPRRRSRGGGRTPGAPGSRAAGSTPMASVQGRCWTKRLQR